MVPRLMTEDEAAERIGCSRRTVRSLRLDGKLPYVAGRPPLLLEADVEAYLSSKVAPIDPDAERDAARGRALDAWRIRKARQIARR